jgi:hypothetical protein
MAIQMPCIVKAKIEGSKDMWQKQIMTLLAKVRRGNAGLPRRRLCRSVKPRSIREAMTSEEDDDEDG